MSDRPDWNEWILQKNQEAKQEELRKSESVTLEKGAAPKIPNRGHSVFTMDHVNEIAAMDDHGAAKKRAHEIVDGSSANSVNKAKIKMMINGSRNPAHLAQGMSNHILAHPSEGLRVIKDEEGAGAESV